MRSSQYPYFWNITPKGEKRNREGSWSRVEQIARISAHFAAALGVVGGFLGVVTASMTASFVSGFRTAKQVPWGRFVNLTLPAFENIARAYSLFVGQVFLSQFIALLIGMLVIGLILLFVFLYINREFPVIISAILSLGGLGGLLWFQCKVLPTQSPSFQKLWAVLGPYLWSFVFFALWKIARTCKKIPPEVVKTFLIFAVIFVFGCVFNLISLPLEAAAYSNRNAGWKQGVEEVCKSPQIIFGKEAPPFSGRRTFLLLRTDAEYYVFTTTVPTTPPSPPEDIASLVLFSPFTACFPASITILPAADMGTVTLVYDEQVKPGECCYQLFGPTPTPTPAPTPSATPDP